MKKKQHQNGLKWLIWRLLFVPKNPTDYTRWCRNITKLQCLSNASYVRPLTEQPQSLVSPLKKTPLFDIYYPAWPINKNNFTVRTMFFLPVHVPAHREGEPLSKPLEMSPLPSSAAWGYYFSVVSAPRQGVNLTVTQELKTSATSQKITSKIQVCRSELRLSV